MDGAHAVMRWLLREWNLSANADPQSVDMRLYRCLQHLQETRLNSPREECMSERQQQVVAGARLWLAVSGVQGETY